MVNAQIVDRTAPHVCHPAAARRRASNQAESTVEARPRPTLPSEVTLPKMPGYVGRYHSLLSCIADGLSMAFRGLGAMFARHRVAAAILFALAVLVSIPMVALSGHDTDCVDDSDCHIPNFGPTRLTYSIPENMGPGIINPMAIPLAMDPDSDDEHLFYTLRDGNAPVENKDIDEAWHQDEDAAAFRIDQTSEGLWLNGEITYDFETQREYKLKVVACDNLLNRDHIDVIISVGDVPEPPGVPTIAEVIGVSTTELLVRWSESENTGPPVTYDLQYRQCQQGECPEGGWTTGPRNITVTNATITGLAQGTKYQVQVMARNDDGVSGWSDSAFGMTLADDLGGPLFREGQSTTRNFDEDVGTAPNSGSPFGAPVTAIGVEPLTYSLVAGMDSDSFDIDSGTGQLKRISGMNYSHEDEDEYNVEVRVSDANGNATIMVTIKVNDVNEPPLKPDKPTVSTDPFDPLGSLSVSWTPPVNTGRPPIIGYDLQYRRRDRSNWTWLSHSRHGTMTTIMGLDMGWSYYVRVRAVNDEGEGPWSEPGTGSTNDENNTAPWFNPSLPVLSFDENIGDAVTKEPMSTGDPVIATDDDEGDTVTYSLEGPNASLFTIDRNSGHISTKQGVNYDYEADPSYLVTVKVEDSKGASTTVEVTISVDNLDESPLAPAAPTVTTDPNNPTMSLSVTWNPPQNRGRPDITGYDLQYREGTSGDWTDGPQDLPGTTRSAIIPDPNTMDLMNPGTSYQVRVRATNGERDDHDHWSLPGMGQTADSDQNEPPKFPDTVTLSFPENAQAGDDIGPPVRAEDTDGDTLKYNLEESTDASSFAIVESSGQIQTTSVGYDYENKNIYYVIVKADDGKGGTAAISVTILVTRVDEGGTGPGGNRRPTRSPSDDGGPSIGDAEPTIGDAKPTFPDASTTRRLKENTEPGLNIGAPVTATVLVSVPLAYALGGADAASFDIDSSTGQLRTKAGVTYDYEVKSSYAVTVTATGSSKASASISVTINLDDVDEKPGTPEAPTVSSPDGSTTTLLATWTAPDLNGGPPLTGYDVQYRQGIDGVWTDWPHTGTDTTTTITQLAAGTDYQVRVRALGEIPSDWSPPASGRTGNVTVNDWVERFGRSIAQQMTEGVQDRLASPCRTGLQGALAGYRFDGDGRGRAGLLERPWITDDAAAMRLHESRLGARDPVSAMGPALLAGTEFELAGETTGGGIACVWGSGAYSSFHGREGRFSLDGKVTTGTLGADYQSGPWTVGVALSHSRGEGRDSSRDDIEAALTGLYPYAGYQITKRLSVWGLGGFGRGGLTVTPPNGTAKETDMGLLMIAAGARSLLLTAPRGMNVAFETDGFWVHAASDGTSGLSATKSDAKRLRFGLESSYRVVLKYGGTLTPRFEVGWRYDGGDADTGLGVDIGGGLVWWAPAGGITAEIEVRRVLIHEATGFNDWNVSGLVRYDPNPSSERGASVALRSSIGPPSFGTANSLLERETLVGLASSSTSDRGQLTAEAAYGFPILGGRFTGAPWVGAGLLESGRDYRVGYRISPVGQFGSHMQIGIEGMRRENDYGDAVAEYAIGLRFALGW